MDYVRKTYVEFIYPNLLCGEGSVKEVESRDVSKVKIPRGAVCFRFFDIIEATVEAEGKSVKLTSARLNESPRYDRGGRVEAVIPYE